LAQLRGVSDIEFGNTLRSTAERVFGLDRLAQS
jgi:hypothetical protein